MNISKLLFLLLLLSSCSCIHRKYSERALRKDTKYFYTKLQETHPNINVHYPIEEFRRDSVELFGSLCKMNRLEYYRTLKPIMTKIKDGHTRLKLPMWIDMLNQKKVHPLLFPYSVKFHNDTAYIINANTGNETIPFGAKICSINKVPIHEIFNKLKSDNESYVDNCFEDMIETSFRKYIWESYGFQDSFLISYKTRDEEIRDTLVKGLSYGLNEWSMQNYRYSQRYQKNRRVFPKATKYRSNNALLYKIFKDKTFAYLRYRQCKRDESNDSLLTEFFTSLKEKNIDHLIIDVRGNTGGTTDVNDLLLKYIGKKPYSMVSKAYVKLSKPIIKEMKRDKESFEELKPFYVGEVKQYYTGEKEVSKHPLLYQGKVYVLSGSSTFSSGANFVATIKDCNLGIVIGQETGGLASSYGDYLIFSLPKTGLKLQVATKFLVRPNEDKSPTGVIPDIIVEKTLDDKLFCRDPELKKVVEIIENMK